MLFSGGYSPVDWGYIMNKKHESGVAANKVFLFAKRFIDIICGIIGSLFTFIVLFFVKIAFLVTGDKDRIIFKQTRIGKDGKPIKIHKIRSMVVNADEILEMILKEDSEKREEYRV